MCKSISGGREERGNLLSYASPWKMDKLIRLEGTRVERGKFPWKFDNWRIRIVASGHDRNLKIDHITGRLKLSVELILIHGCGWNRAR